MTAPAPWYRDTWSAIFNGEALQVAPFVGPVDMVLGDPPYGVGLAPWDRPLTQEELRVFLEITAGPVVLFGAAPVRCLQAMLSLDPPPERVLVWHRPFGLTSSEGAFWSWQPIFVWRKEKLRGLGSDVLRFSSCDPVGRLHPAQKPEGLIAKLILAGTEAGQTVLDPFVGSGTTLRVAKDLGRKSIGIDSNLTDCLISAKRLAQEVLPFHEEERREDEDLGPV